MKTLSAASFLLVLLMGSAFAQNMPFVNQTEIGVQRGSNEFANRTNFTFQTFNGVRINPYHEFGFFIGMDTYPGLHLMPLGMGWRGILEKERKFSPYLSMDIGYGSTLLEKMELDEWNRHSWYDGGMLFHPSIGLRKKTKGKTQLSLSFGYKFQTVHYYEGNPLTGSLPSGANRTDPSHWSYLQASRLQFHNLVLKMGLVF
ncbi:hypothetical protein [Pararhodonellum marinum]|uniref:hypothetical protein n=1 Tax=Pararhodonellum marinum TaxID=2755358 RepID=UPI00188EEB66|nr:hypothetical protein [Pararhodonellum marinum]